MATAFTHAFVAVAFGKAAYPRGAGWKFWTMAILCSAGPDLDVGLHHYGVEFGSAWGHRGMTHSVFFALVLAVVLVSWFFRREARWFGKRWWGLVTFFTLLTASHGFLDAFTVGGGGIAFFAPFDDTRYFMNWQMIEVAPLGLKYMFTEYGAAVMLSELLWIWLPTAVITTPIIVWRVCGGGRWQRSEGTIDS